MFKKVEFNQLIYNTIRDFRDVPEYALNATITRTDRFDYSYYDYTFIQVS